MPYINQLRRDVLDTEMGISRTPGELTYQLTRVVVDYIVQQECFTTYAEAIGALEATKLELYRRMIAPYEDKKREENGDVYP